MSKTLDALKVVGVVTLFGALTAGAVGYSIKLGNVIADYIIKDTNKAKQECVVPYVEKGRK